MSNHVLCHIFSIARTGVLQYIHPGGFSYPQFQEIMTCISLRQMDNFMFGGKYIQSTTEFST